MKKTRSGTRLRRTRMFLILAAFSAAVPAVQAADDAGSSGPRFAISRFAVEGNSLLPGAEVEGLLAPFAGPARSFGDVRRAVDALQQAYRRQGYSVVLVQLPEQELAQGVVRVKVIEPRVGRVAVEGNQGFSTANIRASLPALKEGATPNIRDVSASLKVANTNPAKQITLALQAADRPEEVDAVVRVVEDKPWRVGLTADNTGNADIGRTRLGTLFQHANLWGLDHVASLQYITSAEKPSKVSVFGAGYHVPLYALGDSMDFFASHSDVDSGTVTAGVLPLQISGKGTVLGTRYNQNLPQWGDLSSTLIYGIDWRDLQERHRLRGHPAGRRCHGPSAVARLFGPVGAARRGARIPAHGRAEHPRRIERPQRGFRPSARRCLGQLQPPALRRRLQPAAGGRLAAAPAVQRPGHPLGARLGRAVRRRRRRFGARLPGA